MIPIQKYYRRRFPSQSIRTRTLLWKTLCGSVFQSYVARSSTVMDIGAGYCEFINNIRCKKKYAVDINPDTKKYAAGDVSVLLTNARRIPATYNHSIDVVFMSNFLEHLQKKEDVLTLLVKIKLLLAPGGTLIIMQPNIDLVHDKYWDFFDHTIIFNTENIREVLEICGYHIDTYVVRFLPYTTKNSQLPVLPFLIKLYLSLPEFLRPFAGQSLIIAR